MLNIISKELDVNGSICEVLEKYFDHTNKHRNLIENELDSQFDDYRENNQGEKEKFGNDKLDKLPLQEKLQKLNLDDVVMEFDATSLYTSAMWDKNSIYPRIETGYAFKPQMNKTYVNAFNDQKISQDGNESAALKLKYNNPPDLIFQHLPVKEKIKKYRS